MTIGFEPTEEQRAIVEVAREFAINELRPAADRLEREWVEPRELIAAAAAAGLTSYALPEQYGGGGLDPVTSSMVMEELAYGDCGLATLLGSSQLFGGGIVAATTDEAQRERWISLMCRDAGAIGAIAFSEPHAGSDVASLTTSARRDGDEWVLNGEKTWITGGAPFADAMLVFARTGGPGPRGISAFVVEGDAPGVTCTKLDVLGLRSSWTGSIFLDDVRLPADRLIGAEGEGFTGAMGFFAHSRPQVAAAAVGLARAAFEAAVSYANERTAFGSPIITNQGVSFPLADIGMQIEAARMLVWRACDSIARGNDPGLIGSYAKAFAADVAMRATSEAISVMGAAGLSSDHPTGRWMRDAKVLQIVEGTSQIQRLIASRYYAAGVTSAPI